MSSAKSRKCVDDGGGIVIPSQSRANPGDANGDGELHPWHSWAVIMRLSQFFWTVVAASRMNFRGWVKNILYSDGSGPRPVAYLELIVDLLFLLLLLL